MNMIKVDSETKMHTYDLKFVYYNGKRTEKCKMCKNLFNHNPPSEFEIYWENDKNTEGSSYLNFVPNNNFIGSNPLSPLNSNQN